MKIKIYLCINCHYSWSSSLTRLISLILSFLRRCPRLDSADELRSKALCLCSIVLSYFLSAVLNYALLAILRIMSMSTVEAEPCRVISCGGL